MCHDETLDWREHLCQAIYHQRSSVQYRQDLVKLQVYYKTEEETTGDYL